MNRIRLTKTFHFEMAHALYGHNGPCKNIHGHSYCLEVTVIGTVAQKQNHPLNGMVLDFSELKHLVTKSVIDPMDHALMLNSNSPHKKLVEKNKLTGKIILVPFQPTCENLLMDCVKKIRPLLPKGISLHHLYLSETPSSFAEWYAEDNHFPS